MRSALILALALIPAAPAGAHHSLTAYDASKRVTHEAVVAEFHYTQPHPFMFVEVAGQRWRLEMDNLWELDQIGMKRDTFRPLDRVRVTGSPDRGGRPAMYLRRLERDSDGLVYEQLGMRPSLTIGRD